MHEPLLFNVLFPFIRVDPWQLRNSPKMYSVGRQLRKVFEDAEMDACHLLREFWSCCFNLQNLPKHLVQKVLYIRD
jgi:hypothetical protein